MSWKMHRFNCAFTCVIFISILCSVMCFKFNRENTSDYPEVFLVIRYIKEQNMHYLDVYSPEKIDNYQSNLTSRSYITNPFCELEGATFKKAHVEFNKTLTWGEPEEDQSISYHLQKSIYKIIFEGEGYIQCKARLDGNRTEVKSLKFLKRGTSESFALELLHQSNRTINEKLSEGVTYEVSKEYEVFLNNHLRSGLNSNADKGIDLHSAVIQFQTKSDMEVSILYRITVTVTDIKNMTEEQLDFKLLNILQKIIENKLPKEVNLLNLHSTKYCHNTSLNGRFGNDVKVIKFPTKTLGQLATPDELCVGEDGIPLALTCTGDFITGGKWSDKEDIHCHEPTNRSEKLNDLAKLKYTTNRARDILNTLKNELSSQNENIFAPTEIVLVANALDIINARDLNISDLSTMANITDSILMIPELMEKSGSNQHTNNLQAAQQAINSSNVILESLDRLGNNVELKSDKELFVTKRFVSLSINLKKDNGQTRGIAALKNGDHKYFQKEKIILLNDEDTIDTLSKKNVTVAVLLPKERMVPKHEPQRLVINLFYDDSLFGSKQKRGPSKPIVSVTIDGKRVNDLANPILLMFDAENERKHLETNELSISDSSCVFWDFELNSGKGYWSQRGCTRANPKSVNKGNPKDICVCTHLTHFGELLRDTADVKEETDPIYDGVEIKPVNNNVQVRRINNDKAVSSNNVVLDVITIGGCTASLLGLLGIAVTAMIFPEWRQGTNNQIKLSLCFALALLMLSFLSFAFKENVRKGSDFYEKLPCMLTGISLHYSVIASFCWMLISGWNQYLRLTKPFASLNRTSHYLLKVSLFGWIVPLIPFITVLALDQHVYDPPKCYPSGMYLYFSVFLPVILAVSVNTTIFLMIMFSIYNYCGFGVKLVELRSNQSQRKIAARKLLTSVFLFMLLGLSWIFGILNMTYVFCLTATLQGFFFFLFFVVLDRKTRRKWKVLAEDSKHNDKTLLKNNSISSEFNQKQYSFKRTTDLEEMSE